MGPNPGEEDVSMKMPSYITVYESIGGWKAVLMWWNPDMGGFYEPWQTGLGSYDTEAGAIVEGEWWAECEGLEFRYKAKE